MRIAFMGTPEFAVPALAELLAAGHDIAAVYTQPPRPSGRGQKPRPCPVQIFAEAHGLPVRTPPSLKGAGEQAAFAALDLDVAVVAAYGLILPKAILDAPRHGCLNLHASLLPRWRGAAPIQRAIMAGDKETGVMVMRMEEGLDTGPVLLAEHVPIAADETAGSLHDRLARIGGPLMVRALSALARGALSETPQPEEGVTYARKIAKEESRIDWSRPAAELDRIIRGLTPWPGAFFELKDAAGDPIRLKVLRARPVAGTGAAGAILHGLTIACGEGALEILEVQPAGRRAMSAEEFLRGFRDITPAAGP